jgi:vacuolar-type H+-ATPase subunit F/Vma7
MSSLRVVVRPDLAPGFVLAGVETFPVEAPEAAEALLATWLDDGEAGLIALDEDLLLGLAPSLVRRLEHSDHLFHVAIPPGVFSGTAKARQQRIAALIRQAIGFHITFRHEDDGRV